MAAVIVEISEAVKDELNAGSFSQAFTADRTYRPLMKLSDLQTLRVTVVPRSMEIESAGRSSGSLDYGVDIGVRKKLTASSADADADALTLLVEEIVAFFARRRLASYAPAVLTRAENAPIFSPEHLEEEGVFLSVITLFFKVLD